MRAFSITELTSIRYNETACSGDSLLHASGMGRHRSGLSSHADAYSIGDRLWITCVDGFDRYAQASKER